MPGVRVQAAVVVALFLGSLSVLAFNTFSALELSGREPQVRARLREASRRMAEAAASLADSLSEGGRPPTPALDRRLRGVTSAVLAEVPGVEGGFYFAGADRFGGFTFPTGGRGTGPPPAGSDPPPQEAPYIRVQARQSVGLPPGDFRVSTQDVGPSRVVFLSEPVGTRRPAPLATWVMYRLYGPEQLEREARRYAASTGLALGSVALALLLTANLGRTLKRQRAEQERLRDELRRAEHLAALGRLLAGVAHEVRNPLAGIRSTVQLWQRLPDAARTPGSLAAVVGAVDRLDDLVGRLLHFSRADAAERRPVDLNAVVAESLDLVGAQAAAQGVTVQRDLAADLPAVPGAANALRQVALNLLGNALQAMPAGGRLRCSTRRGRDGTVELRVEDTGPGIDEKDRPRLFEPFFTTRPDGTGLGLALCREIVLGHAGRVELESTGPAGSVFLVVLPSTVGQAASLS